MKIHSKKEYRKALKDFEILMLEITIYEDNNFFIGKPTPLEAIKFRMEQQGLKQKDMTEYLGARSKVSEVLSGKRPLSKRMMRNLCNGLGIPAEILIS